MREIGVLEKLVLSLSKRVEEILKKETALTSDDISAIKELSDVITNLSQICLFGSQYASVHSKGFSSQRSTKES